MFDIGTKKITMILTVIWDYFQVLIIIDADLSTIHCKSYFIPIYHIYKYGFNTGTQ